MFYKRQTAAVVAILTALSLTALFICAPHPYSKKIWLEAIMLLVGGGLLAIVSVRLREKEDSSLPVSIAAVQLTSWYFLFVAVLGVLLFFDFWIIKFKYYALIHLLGLGGWAIMLLILRMGTRSIDEQDAIQPVSMSVRRIYYLSLSRIIDGMRSAGGWDESVVLSLDGLVADFRLGFGRGIGVDALDKQIGALLAELQEAVRIVDKERTRQLVDSLRREFDDRERTARMKGGVS